MIMEVTHGLDKNGENGLRNAEVRAGMQKAMDLSRNEEGLRGEAEILTPCPILWG